MHTRYEIALSRDNTHDGPQWWAEVLELTVPGTGVEDAEPIYATTWYATQQEAQQDAQDWLWTQKHTHAR